MSTLAMMLSVCTYNTIATILSKPAVVSSQCDICHCDGRPPTFDIRSRALITVDNASSSPDMNSRDVEDFYDSVTAQPPADDADVPPMNYDDMPMPSLEKIIEMIQGMQGISDEEKNSLLQSVLSQSQSNMDLEQLNSMRSSSPSYQFMVLFGLLCVLALIFVFFGYKLYKSLTEKEKKREEKRKQKQMKKKK